MAIDQEVKDACVGVQLTGRDHCRQEFLCDFGLEDESVGELEFLFAPWNNIERLSPFTPKRVRRLCGAQGRVGARGLLVRYALDPVRAVAGLASSKGIVYAREKVGSYVDRFGRPCALFVRTRGAYLLIGPAEETLEVFDGLVQGPDGLRDGLEAVFGERVADRGLDGLEGVDAYDLLSRRYGLFAYSARVDWQV